MKMKLILLTAILLLIKPSVAFAQQHAPIPDVCRADVAVWYNVEMAIEYNEAEAAWATDKVSNKTPTAKLPLREVLARMHEMYTCEKVDQEKTTLYHSAGNFYYGVFTDRALQFINRHNLRQQLQREDDAGIR